MKVLVLTQYFWPESFRINEVVVLLQRMGCEITVLTGQPNYPQGQVFEGYRAAGLGTRQHEAGYSICRVPLVPRGDGGALRLVANYLSFVLSATVLGPWLLRWKAYDLIFVYAPSPILQVMPAVWLAFIKHAKLVTWVQDLWPQSLEATGFVRNRRVLGMTAVLVRWIYRRCDLLLVQSRAFVSPVQAMAGITPVHYHPNPGELVADQSQPVGGPALQLKPGFNVVFAGNLGTVQALDTVLDAAELLQLHEDVHVVLVGSGSRSDWLQHEVARRRLRNVQTPGRFPPEVMPGILAQASVLLVSLVRSPIMSQTVPSKMQAYLAAGKAIIGSLDGEGARLLSESGAGLACAAEDGPALAAAVLRLRALSPDALQRMGEAGERYYRQNFDPDILAAKLVEHFSQVLAGCRR
ncbi:glycosyltransferase family 4 protein [Polynucleobacter sp. 39-46-10]|uniref:glycosyltransferase family 4 protein n=1 Tax=Polynucleobacter sp. 39-46-10 TaxID=1970428 RepID=UPI000BD86AD0|nr:glycosyltransferase family 4 protein [Polynucleobacter sp. 39-46-10]OZA76459.1 MAG: glycosyltransferase WbuB [Polynucleobacter sp. 39-46-10]